MLTYHQFQNCAKRQSELRGLSGGSIECGPFGKKHGAEGFFPCFSQNIVFRRFDGHP